MNNSEIWLPVVGYENYEVSNLGRVRSLASGRVMRPQKNRGGYLRVGLSKNGKGKMHSVHRLVATAFIPNPLGLPEVNHINEVKTDNRAENLEWCDRYYNATYGLGGGRFVKEKREVFQYDLDGEFVAWYPSTVEAERLTGVNAGCIANCANGKCNTQGGSQWSYLPALFLDATDGRLNDAKSKRVYQYDLEGRFVKEWASVAEVQRQTGWSRGHISMCCNGKFKQRYGFRWFYEFQGYSLK